MKYVANIYTDVYADSFEEGEKERVNFWTNKIFAASLPELLGKIKDELCLENMSDICYSGFVNKYEDSTELWADSLVNVNNDVASEKEKADWEKGLLNLYVQRHFILISELKPVNPDDLLNTGITMEV